MQLQSMLIRHRCTARSMARRAKPTSKTAVVIIQLMLTLRFASRPPVEVSQAAKLRRIFEPHYKYLADDLPQPEV
jgi:hypothetical protein